MGAAAGNGHQVDYLRAAGLVVAGQNRADWRPFRSAPEWRGVDALRMCASASSLLRWRFEARSRGEEIARKAYNVVFPGSRWRASLRLTMYRTAVTSAWSLGADALSGLRPSQAVCRRLRP